jgi:hypothetical protein
MSKLYMEAVKIAFSELMDLKENLTAAQYQ